jgi:hypothetical protein
MLGGLVVIWMAVNRGVAWTKTSATPLTFDDEPAGSTVTLELWDSR